MYTLPSMHMRCVRRAVNLSFWLIGLTVHFGGGGGAPGFLTPVVSYVPRAMVGSASCLVNHEPR